MKRIYVAGPYSADNVLDVLHNIRKGISASANLFKAGYAPFSPWLDYHYVFEDHNRELTVSQFYEYSIAFLDVCEAVYVLDGWENSKGTLKEIERANSLGIPVFYDHFDFVKNIKP